jgi:hypothetical protein
MRPGKDESVLKKPLKIMWHLSFALQSLLGSLQKNWREICEMSRPGTLIAICDTWHNFHEGSTPRSRIISVKNEIQPCVPLIMEIIILVNRRSVISTTDGNLQRFLLYQYALYCQGALACCCGRDASDGQRFCDSRSAGGKMTEE